MKRLTRTQERGHRYAFSLLEVVISLFLVGTIMVVALEALTASTRGRTRNGNRARALLLAHGLLEEIVEQAYLEPDDTAVFGPESGEADGTRAAFDDIDDYHGWSASPPQARDGTTLPVPDDWTRKVEVQWVQPNSIDVISPSDAGLKLVVVTVDQNGETLAELSAVATQSRQVLPAVAP